MEIHAKFNMVKCIFRPKLGKGVLKITLSCPAVSQI